MAQSGSPVIVAVGQLIAQLDDVSKALVAHIDRTVADVKGGLRALHSADLKAAVAEFPELAEELPQVEQDAKERAQRAESLRDQHKQVLERMREDLKRFLQQRDP